MKRVCLVLVVCLLSVLWAGAQEAPRPQARPEAAAAAQPPEPEAPAPAPLAAPVPLGPKGDVITFKRGAVLGGVQVVKRTPLVVELEIIPGVTLSIPRKQVVNIEYDDFEPQLGRESAAQPPTPEEIPGDKLKPEVSARLTNEIPGLPLEYENEDVLNILSELSKRAGVPIEVDDSVKNLPQGKRLWTIKATPGTTLMMLLQKDLLETFEDFSIVYQYDKLLVTVKGKGPQAPPPGRANVPPAPPKPVRE